MWRSCEAPRLSWGFALMHLERPGKRDIDSVLLPDLPSGTMYTPGRVPSFHGRIHHDHDCQRAHGWVADPARRVTAFRTIANARLGARSAARRLAHGDAPIDGFRPRPRDPPRSGGAGVREPCVRLARRVRRS